MVGLTVELGAWAHLQKMARSLSNQVCDQLLSAVLELCLKERAFATVEILYGYTG